MERESNSISMLRFVLRPAAVSSLALGLLCTGIVYASSPVSLAPPVNSGAATSTDPAVTYNWTGVPENQDVAISRATFDRGGYQLYDDSGDIIVIPFVNNNLFVMKFACSTDGRMYFVRQGNTPVLYLPKGGYLENATVPGARWYPFGSGFEPQTPVSMGIAPTMDDYIDMGWYAGTVCDGGYYGNSKNDYVPCSGYGFNVNGHKYKGWKSYCEYWVIHAPPYHSGYSNPGLHNTPILQWRNPTPPGGRHPWTGRPQAGGAVIEDHSRKPIKPVAPVVVNHARSFTPAPAPVVEDYSRHFTPAPAPVVEDHSRDFTPAPAPVVEDHSRDFAPAPAPVVEDHSRSFTPAPAPVVEDHSRDFTPAPAPVVEDHSRNFTPAPAPVVEDHSRDFTPAPAPVVEDHSRDFTPAPAPVVEDHSHDYTPPAPVVDNTPPPAPAQQTPSAPSNPAPAFDPGPGRDIGIRR